MLMDVAHGAFAATAANTRGNPGAWCRSERGLLCRDDRAANDAWDEALETLASYRGYGPDWDGQGATAIATPAIDTALAWILTRQFRGDSAPPGGAVPDPHGGVALEWNSPGGSTTVEFDANGNASMLVFDAAGNLLERRATA